MKEEKNKAEETERNNSDVSVMFIFKVLSKNHARFSDWITRFEKYKDNIGIRSEHYIVFPLPKGKFNGWRGVEEAIESAEDEEVWVTLEHFTSRKQRTEYLETMGDPERKKILGEMPDLVAPNIQIMNELFTDSWGGYRR